jgi:hypothetical protein
MQTSVDLDQRVTQESRSYVLYSSLRIDYLPLFAESNAVGGSASTRERLRINIICPLVNK